MYVCKLQDQVCSVVVKVGVCGIVYVFNGSLEQVCCFVDLGFKFGFGGVFIFLCVNWVCWLVQDMLIELIVLEIDVFDLVFVWFVDDQFGEQGVVCNVFVEVVCIVEVMV